jgi:hypothetical protein
MKAGIGNINLVVEEAGAHVEEIKEHQTQVDPSTAMISGWDYQFHP